MKRILFGESDVLLYDAGKIEQISNIVGVQGNTVRIKEDAIFYPSLCNLTFRQVIQLIV